MNKKQNETKLELMVAVLALFRQNITRKQIAKELKISVEVLDEEMDALFCEEKKPFEEKPFVFEEHLDTLVMPIRELLELNWKDRCSIHVLRGAYAADSDCRGSEQDQIPVWKFLMVKELFKERSRIRFYGKKVQAHFIETLNMRGIFISEAIHFSKEQIQKLEEYSS